MKDQPTSTMHRGFTKLFNTIVTSTIWQEDDKTRIVWITMLAISDADGIVSAAIPGLASVANVSVEATDRAIKNLKSPDPYSRTKDFNGRRIEDVDGGWRILNYAKYRRMLNEEERREYKAKWIAEKRRQKSTMSTQVDRSRRSASASASKSKCTSQEAEEFCKSIGLPRSDGVAMFLHWEEKGWAKVKDWKLTIRKWQSFGYLPSQKRKPDGARLDNPKRLDPSKVDLPERFKSWFCTEFSDRRDEIMKWKTWADVPPSLRQNWWKVEKDKLPIEL